MRYRFQLIDGYFKESLQVRFEDVNASLERLGDGDVIGRAVIVYD